MKKRLQLVALSVLTGAALVNVNASAASTENYPNALLIQAEDDDQAGDNITSGDQDEVTLPLDMTSYIVNPYMDSKDGWLSTCSAQNKALTSNKQGDFTGQFYEHWNSSAFDGKFYQIIEDFPDRKCVV